MRTPFAFVLLTAALILFSCKKTDNPDAVSDNAPITIASPSPATPISKMSLTDTQARNIESGNSFAINCFKDLYGKGSKDLVFSPLSLQYVLALTVNGASGETAAEITRALGFGEDIEALNAYCNLLLNQLPALDTTIVLQLADAVLVDNMFSVQDSFRNTVETVYYAPVEYVDATNPKRVVERINEWASRNTNGFINPFLDEEEILGNFASILLNTLYFKAQWGIIEGMPIFNSSSMKKGDPFYYDDGREGVADYMVSSRHFRYGRLGENGIVELPYADGNYAMYILLPDKRDNNTLSQLVSSLSAENWKAALLSMTSTAKVNICFPRFEVVNKTDLTDIVRGQGIRSAFDPARARFDRMLVASDADSPFSVQKVLQKARIIVSEWGTEAGAVTVEVMTGEGPENPQTIDFYANHPFAYIIAEKTTGLILFEGVYTGNK